MRGVSREVEFLGEIEDARTAGPLMGGVGGEEHRFEMAHFPGDARHLLPAERHGVGKHRQAVAAVGL